MKPPEDAAGHVPDALAEGLAAEHGWDAQHVAAAVVSIRSFHAQADVRALLAAVLPGERSWDMLAGAIRDLARARNLPLAPTEIRELTLSAEELYALQVSAGAAPFRALRSVFERVIGDWLRRKTEVKARPAQPRLAKPLPAWARGEALAAVAAAARSANVELNGDTARLVDTALDIYGAQMAGGSDADGAKRRAVELAVQHADHFKRE